MGLTILGDTELEEAPATDGKPDADVTAERLGASGIRPSMRLLYRSDPTTSGGEFVAVRCRLRGSRDGGGEGNPSRDGIWTPPNVEQLRLTLPVQATLLDGNAHVRLSRTYHENSKIRRLYRDQHFFASGGVPPAIQRVTTQGVKDYRHAPLEYELVRDSAARTVPVEECIRQRRSMAPMGDGPLSTKQLAHLLQFSYGVTGAARSREGIRQPLRAAPSGGGLYPIDLYILAERVDGIDRGIYYYHPLRHRLQLVRRSYPLDELADHTGYGGRLRQAAVIVLYAAAFGRNQWKYRERGYRIVLMDCGHLAQNVLLVATALGMVAHPVTGFVDDYFNDLLGLDGVDESVLYLNLLAPSAGHVQDAAVKAGTT
jgi:SagB-type dehydrogenase family enzyme